MIFSLKNRLKVLIYIGAGVLILTGFFTEGPEVAGITTGRLSIVESVLVALIVAFNRWIWRWPLVVAVLKTGPVLRGTWKGTTTSTYDGQTRDVYVAVRQTFAEIEVRFLTEESTSETTSCQLIRKPEELSIVEYTYANTPRQMVRKRSAPHFGATRLECTGQRPTRLEGGYWTDRQTTGEITLTSHVPQIKQTFTDAEAAFTAK